MFADLFHTASSLHQHLIKLAYIRVFMGWTIQLVPGTYLAYAVRGFDLSSEPGLQSTGPTNLGAVNQTISPVNCAKPKP